MRACEAQACVRFSLSLSLSRYSGFSRAMAVQDQTILQIAAMPAEIVPFPGKAVVYKGKTVDSSGKPISNVWIGQVQKCVGLKQGATKDAEWSDTAQAVLDWKLERGKGQKLLHSRKVAILKQKMGEAGSSHRWI